jgi:outer membrane protein TolC
MNVLPRTLSVLLALGAAAPSARAQTSNDAAGLSGDATLRRLIQESLAARPEVKSAEVTVAADRERIPQVGALPDPVLQLGIQNDGFNGLQIGTAETSFYQIMVSQGLPWPGKRGLRREVARHGVSVAESGVARIRLTTEADVRRAYLDLLLVRERLELLARLEELWQKSIGTARARYEAGEGAQSDLLRAQLELNRIAQRRVGLQAEETTRLQALNRLRSHPLDEPIPTSLRLRDLPLPTVPTLEAATADAEERSPDLAAARAGVAQANAQVDLARRERFPDLGVQLALMPRGKLEPMWAASVSIGLPIWSGSKQSRAVAESTDRSAASTSTAESVAQVLRLRVAERRAALTSLVETIRLYRQGVLVQSLATVDSTLAQYRTGKVTFASVLEANQGLIGDEEGHLLAVAEAERITIASDEVSMEASGVAGAAGGMAGAPVPGAGAAGGGAMGSGGSKAAAPPAAAAAAPSSSSM